jgi:DDE superfamily endonuclease
VAAGHSVDSGRWLGLLDELMLRAAPRFRRAEPRRRARAFVLGLLAALPRKNCWTIAEQPGDATPDGMQHLLSRARWDVDGVRDDVRGFVVEHLGDPSAVLVADETGDLKKGALTAGSRLRTDAAPATARPRPLGGWPGQDRGRRPLERATAPPGAGSVGPPGGEGRHSHGPRSCTAFLRRPSSAAGGPALDPQDVGLDVSAGQPGPRMRRATSLLFSREVAALPSSEFNPEVSLEAGIVYARQAARSGHPPYTVTQGRVSAGHRSSTFSARYAKRSGRPSHQLSRNSNRT